MADHPTCVRIGLTTESCAFIRFVIGLVED
jgi:hypothetical protein